MRCSLIMKMVRFRNIANLAGGSEVISKDCQPGTLGIPSLFTWGDVIIHILSCSDAICRLAAPFSSRVSHQAFI